MDHAATMRRLYDLLNAGDVDGFGDFLADGFVELPHRPSVGPRPRVDTTDAHVSSAVTFPESE